MNYLSLGRWLLSGAMVIALVSCATPPPDPTIRFLGKLTGANEVPAVSTQAEGIAEVSFNKDTGLLKWKVSYSGMSGPVRGAHFHGPALAGQNAGIALGFKSSLDSPIQEEATLSAAQTADLLAGRWYVNLHTARNPAGEIRAQLIPVN